jgi:hypothetical protein
MCEEGNSKLNTHGELVVRVTRKRSRRACLLMEVWRSPARLQRFRTYYSGAVFDRESPLRNSNGAGLAYLALEERIIVRIHWSSRITGADSPSRAVMDAWV